MSGRSSRAPGCTLRRSTQVSRPPRMFSFLRPFLVLLALPFAARLHAGQAAESSPAVAAPAAPAAFPPQPVGEIKPAPEGCLSLTFIAPDDDRRAVRNSRGRIADVLNAKGGKEPVIARISRDEIEELVPLIDAIIAGRDPEPLSHIPAFYAQGHIPGPAAWEYLKRFLREGDEFWSYGETETGLLVIRDNRLLCLMHIPVPFSD
jgi:hypothetical protein